MVRPQERPRGAIDDESEALPGRFIDQSLAGFGDGIGIDGVTYVARFALFQMLGKVCIPSPETVRPPPEGTEDAVGRAREDEESVLRWPVSGAISWSLRAQDPERGTHRRG